MISTQLKPPADGAVSAYPETAFDAVIVVSFGGPEGHDDVMPFLENVLRGRNVPQERMLAVAEHYYHFGGVSPINGQNRAIIAALRAELDAHGISLPIYFGNRNWHPLLSDTLRQMRDDGIKKALAFFTSVSSSYSGCRQYRENIYNAQQEVGPGAPEIYLTRKPYNHPGFIEPNIEYVRTALESIPQERRAAVHLAFCAHSIPQAMADNCAYEAQLNDSARLIAEGAGVADYKLVYQSRSGPPQQPWLEPDINDHLKTLAEQGIQDVIMVPVGFISDHMEVMYDLDHEAMDTGHEVGLNLVRVPTVSTHPRFIAMIRELIQERLTEGSARPTLGERGPSWDVCPVTCCLPGTGKPSPWAAE